MLHQALHVRSPYAHRCSRGENTLENEPRPMRLFCVSRKPQKQTMKEGRDTPFANNRVFLKQQLMQIEKCVSYNPSEIWLHCIIRSIQDTKATRTLMTQQAIVEWLAAGHQLCCGLATLPITFS